MQSAKPRDIYPILKITYYKDLDTLQYILGDRREIEARQKAEQDQRKNDADKKKKDDQNKEKDAKIKEINKLKRKFIQDEEDFKANFGYFTMLMFMAMYIGHIYLSYLQYQCYNMYFFNEAVTKYLFPGIDPEVVISSKQFLTNHEMEKWFLLDVNERFKGASENITDKPMFHKFNHIHPYFKVTTVQANETECGSISSNLKGKNEAALKGEEPSSEYTFPYDYECFTVFQSGILRNLSLGEGANQTVYSPTGGAISRGFLNDYDGSGFTRVIKLNTTNEDFFGMFFKENIIDTNYTSMPSTLAIIV